jgi:hypothetical protein
VAFFGWFMPSRTVRGTRELEKVLGFREFLTRVEADRLDRIVKTPAMFEKFLPYAMALGVEDNWAKAFEGIYNEPPTWYTGPGGVTTFTRRHSRGTSASCRRRPRRRWLPRRGAVVAPASAGDRAAEASAAVAVVDSEPHVPFLPDGATLR